MADYIDMENLKFLLFKVHDLDAILQYDRYKDYDLEAISILLDSVKDWGDKEFYPFFTEMDEKPAYYEDGGVRSHPQVARIMKQAGEQGFIGATFDYDHLGTQLPKCCSLGMNHIIQSANNHVPGYIGLTSGAADLIKTFGSQELFDQYVPRMMAGEWTGTMALTEPWAGSSLSDIKCSAKLNPDGSYNIKGQKIFISGGDLDGVENIVHLTIARIEGAPKGTKGISLFVVPKLRTNADGQLQSNDVITAGDFQKLGQRGYSTVHLSYGEQDDCKGWIVGDENRGLSYMFQMMNGARIDVGLTACSTSTAAYYASLQYAMERPQGRKLSKDGSKDVNEEQTLIINHPDVRRMLFLQKSVNEASLSLLLYCSRLEDIIINGSEKEAEEAHLLLELLTPVAKTYPSEMGQVAISNGLQVLGGYGFCMDFPLQQYYRDIRIMSIYEGTTGIQSLDLLGRKILFKQGEALKILMNEIGNCIGLALGNDDLKVYGEQLKSSLANVEEVLSHLMPFAMKGDYEKFLADATIFMEMFGTIVIAWQWLLISISASDEIKSEGGNYSNTFLESKIHCMKYFFNYELPKVTGLKDTLLRSEFLTIKGENEYLI